MTRLFHKAEAAGKEPRNHMKMCLVTNARLGLKTHDLIAMERQDWDKANQ